MELSPADRARLIGLYAAGYAAVMSALEAMTVEELEAREGPDEWCPREVIHHLGDSEMDGAGRIRMLVAERRPVLTGWDQDRWVDVLYSKERPIEASLTALKAAREATLPLLRLLTDEQWRSAGNHSEFGTMTGDDWLAFYGTHAHDHAEQIRRARAAVRERDIPGEVRWPGSGPPDNPRSADDANRSGQA
jgi:DinB superfamily